MTIGLAERVEFLKTVSPLKDADVEVIERIAADCEERRYRQGELILQQGRDNGLYFFLRTGRVAVRLETQSRRETIATLDPPTLFGELSSITQEGASADVEAIYDSDVLTIDGETLNQVGRGHPSMLIEMVRFLAHRLHQTTAPRAAELPVVLLSEHPRWEASRSFSESLAQSVAEQATAQALLVRVVDGNTNGDLLELGGGASVTRISASEGLRDELVKLIPKWQERFKVIFLQPFCTERDSVNERLTEVATEQGHLLGPGDQHSIVNGRHRQFVVGSGEQPMLPMLDGSRQLLFEAAATERNHEQRRPVTTKFQRTVDSIARHILDIQVGLACGGGAAWGFAHIGVFKVLEAANIPIDVVSGNSAGTLIGGMRCCGRSPEQIRHHVLQLTKNRLRLFEWRIWKMHMIRESTIRKNFEQAYGETLVNATEIPFWANALNIETGEEVNITRGPLRTAVRASICLPGLFPPVVHDDALLIDAGMTDSVPINQVREMGCRYAIATNVMQDLKAHTLSRKYPRNLLHVVYRALQACGHEIGAARCERASDVIIKPDVGEISMLGFHRVDELIKAGERATQEQLPLIQASYGRLRARC